MISLWKRQNRQQETRMRRERKRKEMNRMPRFNFTRENRKTGKTESAGYLDMTTNAEKESCSLYFYGDIVSTTWDGRISEH